MARQAQPRAHRVLSALMRALLRHRGLPRSAICPGWGWNRHPQNSARRSLHSNSQSAGRRMTSSPTATSGGLGRCRRVAPGGAGSLGHQQGPGGEGARGDWGAGQADVLVGRSAAAAHGPGTQGMKAVALQPAHLGVTIGCAFFNIGDLREARQTNFIAGESG